MKLQTIAPAVVGMAIGLVGLNLTAGPASAVEFPVRPVTIIVSLAPGGTADVLARAVGSRLSEEFKQPVIVENKAGANTQVAANAVAKAEPDGYTLLATPDFTLSVNPFLYKQQSTIGQSLVPIAGLGEASMALVVNSKFPASDMGSLISRAKEHPGKLNFGVPGVGSTSHLGMELLQARAGIKVNPIPYKGAAAELTDLIAGHVDAVFVALGLVSESAKVASCESWELVTGSDCSSFRKYHQSRKQCRARKRPSGSGCSPAGHT